MSANMGLLDSRISQLSSNTHSRRTSILFLPSLKPGQDGPTACNKTAALAQQMALVHLKRN